MPHLRTLIIVTNADPALAVKALRPEATELDVGLRKAGVGEEEPCTEDGLGEDIENGVGDDLRVNTGDAGAIGNTPDTIRDQHMTCVIGMQDTYIG